MARVTILRAISMKALLLALACSCASTRPAPDRPQELDLTMTAHRALGDVQADAVVRFAPGLDPAARARHAGLAGARAWLQVARGSKDPAHAYAAAQHGTDELGKDYTPSGTNNDTGTKLQLAATRADENDLVGAARIAVEILDERIQMYVRRYQAEVQ